MVDSDSERLYWVNAGSGSMQYLDVPSGTLTTLETAAGARPAALDVHAGELVWADTATAALYACDKDRCAAHTTRLLRNDTGNAVWHIYFSEFSYT